MHFIKGLVLNRTRSVRFIEVSSFLDIFDIDVFRLLLSRCHFWCYSFLLLLTTAESPLMMCLLVIWVTNGRLLSIAALDYPLEKRVKLRMLLLDHLKQALMRVLYLKLQLFYPRLGLFI